MRKLGCIADDFTGATDVAAVLASIGRRVAVVFDIDSIETDNLGDADAVIVAFKSRTAPVDEAVALSLAGVERLLEWGAEQFYVKYCSTLDSTPAGNIGPVIEAVAKRLSKPTVIVAPAYPRNGRTVYQGHLFVGHMRLDESPMRHHPLTPMTDSDVGRVLSPQTALSIDHLYLAEVRDGRDSIVTALADRGPRAVVADAIDDHDLVALASGSGSHVLLTGGAGLALGLGGDQQGGARPMWSVPADGEKLIVAGSASSTTRAQIAVAKGVMPARQLDLGRLSGGEDLSGELIEWVASQWKNTPGQPVLVYATADLDELGEPATRLHLAERIEATLADLCVAAVDHGLGALLVAGGETSGRVVSTLGIQQVHVGTEIAPGVVWAIGTPKARAGNAPIAIALKSGNFGADDMFISAWEQLR
jgi:3-dehydrotetronate 4-kinase